VVAKTVHTHTGFQMKFGAIEGVCVRSTRWRSLRKPGRKSIEACLIPRQIRSQERELLTHRSRTVDRNDCCWTSGYQRSNGCAIEPFRNGVY